MPYIYRRLTVIAIIIGLALVIGGRALAQQPTCANTAGEPRTCVNFVLSPSDLTGDFIVGNNTLPSAVNVNDYGLMGDSTFVGTRVAVYVQNIHDHTPEYGVLYVYQDVLGLATFPALGQTVTRTLRPTRTYIRGTLDLTCDIRSYAGESVACAVTIDEATPSENASVSPGQRVSYILDPGAHSVTVSLSGDPAQTILWTPASIIRTVNITASATPTRQTFRFDKAGHLIVTLNQPGVVGDFYIDGALIASQVASIDQYVTPGVSHRVEARNLTDPAAQGEYRWRDASTRAVVSSGRTRQVVIRLVRETVLAPANPADAPTPPTYVTGAGVSEDDLTLAQEGIGMAANFWKARGYDAGPIRVYIYNDLTELVRAYMAYYGVPESEFQNTFDRWNAGTVGESGGDAMWIYMARARQQYSDRGGLFQFLAHEHFHLVQNALYGRMISIGPNNTVPAAGPVWLIEGCAHYESYRLVGANDLLVFANWVRLSHQAVRRSPIPLSSMEMWDTVHAANADVYMVGMTGCEYLSAWAGPRAPVEYWRTVGTLGDWQAAFQTQFGLTPAQFYQQFQTWVTSGFPAVTGP